MQTGINTSTNIMNAIGSLQDFAIPHYYSLSPTTGVQSLTPTSRAYTIGPISKIKGKNNITSIVSKIWLHIESYSFGHLKYHLLWYSMGNMQLQQNYVLHLKQTIFMQPSPFSRSIFARHLGHLRTSFWQKSLPSCYLDELLHDLPGCQGSLHLRQASFSHD